MNGEYKSGEEFGIGKNQGQMGNESADRNFSHQTGTPSDNSNLFWQTENASDHNNSNFYNRTENQQENRLNESSTRSQSVYEESRNGDKDLKSQPEYHENREQSFYQQGNAAGENIRYQNGQNQRIYNEPVREQNNYKQEPSKTYSYSNPDFNSYEEQEKKKKEKREKSQKGKKFAKKAVVMVASAAVLGCVAGGSFYGVNRLANYVFYDETQQEVAESVPEEKKVVTTTTSANTSTTVTDVTNVVKNVMPSVVSITSKATEVKRNFFGQAYQYETEGSGSGIIVGQSDTELLIATNNHVIEGSDELTVYFINDDTITAKIKGRDSDMDLAVIAVDLSQMSAETLGAITVATLGDSDVLQVGEPAIAIGNALGYGQSVTTGVVSALNRSVEDSKEENGFIQTDAAINPGNSGGALLNVQGQVIGINSMKISSGGYTEASIEGMGYAIPISAAKPIIDELMNKETRDKVDENNMGYLGIRGATIGDEMHEIYNMPYGIYVSEVIKGSSAEQAGLLSGDVIIKFDGTKISSYEELQNQLQYYSAGETIQLVVERPENGEYVEQTITITLGARNTIEQ